MRFFSRKRHSKYRFPLRFGASQTSLPVSVAMFQDMLQFQDTLLDAMKIPRDPKHMRAYQRDIYDHIEMRKNRLVEELARLDICDDSFSQAEFCPPAKLKEIMGSGIWN